MSARMRAVSAIADALAGAALSEATSALWQPNRSATTLA
jgi:hypothetical protein